MADSLSVDTGGTDRLAASLAGAATALRDASDLAATVAARVLSDATSRAPRGTGALAGSGRLTGTDQAAVLTWGVRYALYVNFGTTTMRARPFATDALDAAAADADPLLAQWAGTILDHIDA